ncbi:hypothetical protein [Winogradskyella marincola]|uniref:PsbP C-terminal domain-containing protein n=1 Tax=Winogradskyella marincola TaxID=3037795 RepID=A0ABT6G0Z3_9FLAO|nr:hypothetical protein [Winogradskyella sp. YYF002]MDG4715696.1 hypothetical protein [Winogradskyella sp. YYF002]
MKHAFFILFLFPLIVLSQENEDFKIYKNKNYSIEYPLNWNLDTSGDNGTEIYIYPKESNNSEIFVENINLLIQNLNDSTATIESCKILVEQQIEAMMTDSKFIVSEIVNKDKHKFHKLIAEGTYNTYKFKTIIYTWYFNKHIYTLTFVTLSEDYINNHTLALKIMDSFSLENNN